MYLSRVILNRQVNKYKLAKAFQNSYYEHQMIWKLFDNDPDAKRDFLYRQNTEHGQIKYYILSKRIPKDKENIWFIETKTYDPKLFKEQRLFFILKANPVVMLKTSNGKRQRHDIVMHAKKLNSRQSSFQELIQGSCTKWLEKRSSQYGFTLKAVHVHGYRQHVISSKGRKISYSTVDFKGDLIVNDPLSFKNALFSGIGKSRSFGCGLLMVKK